MTQLMLTTTPRGRDYYAHFTVEKTIKKLKTHQGHSQELAYGPDLPPEPTCLPTTPSCLQVDGDGGSSDQ